MINGELSLIFDRMADILEFRNENPFKIRAYRRAARILEEMTRDITTVFEEGKLREIPGVGEGIARKIQEYIETGRMKKYEEARTSVPDGLIEMLGIPSLGPRSLAQLHGELGVRNMEELQRAIENGRVARLKGFGAKKADNILRGIAFLSEGMKRMPLGIAQPIADRILSALKKDGSSDSIEAAGSLRRCCETIGDIDILATGKNGKAIIGAFVRLPGVKDVLAAGGTKASIRVDEGKQVDLRVVPGGSFGSALQYFTGSKEHNIRLREIAKEKGLKLSEYGIFKKNRKVAGRTEREVYRALGMDWIPPELREDRGEIKAALRGKLPHLIMQEEIRGDLHVHSDWSDGILSIERIAEIARKMKYSYIAVADHSRSLKIASGLSIEKICEQMEKIDSLNERSKGIRILKGAEVDILSDGKLDFPDDLLARLDIVIASIHSGFSHSETRITGRILSAIENPHVDIIAHPTGRLMGEREPYKVDMEKVMEAAATHGKALELNSHYLRLDLDHLHCRMAKESGVRISIGTDSHREEHFSGIRYGLAVARKGWLTKSDVLNTLPLVKLLRWSSHS